MAFEIEKGIPIPPKDSKNNHYPIKGMAIGDSFLFVNPKPSSRSAMHSVARWFGMVVTIRKVSEGLRVWRIK